MCVICIAIPEHADTASLRTLIAQVIHVYSYVCLCVLQVGGREGLEWKTALIESVMRCPQKAAILSPALLDTLDRILRRGPFAAPLLPIPPTSHLQPPQ
jgi:hypothetical protein